MRRMLMIVLTWALAGCQQLPLTPEDIQAKKFEAVPDKAVIYLVRDNPDFSSIQSQISVGDKLLLKTYPGTYYRWEVPPGMHRISGYGSDIGTIGVQAERGRVYFVQQRVSGLYMANSAFALVGEPQGRAAVLRAILLAPGQ